MTSTPIRILLADDHEVVREGLAAILRRRVDEFDVVAEVDDGEQALEAWARLRPDVAVLDLRMPRLDGVSTIKAIRKIDATARLIILTTYDTDEDIYQGLRAGAKGYLLKDADRQTILDAIRTVARGQTYIPSVVAARLASRIRGNELTTRETEVLGFIAKGMSNKEIAHAIGITEGTVKFYSSALYAKLDVTSRAGAINAAVERGLLKMGSGA
jgi:two-component system, NarL family, response regulator